MSRGQTDGSLERVVEETWTGVLLVLMLESHVILWSRGYVEDVVVFRVRVT